MSWAVKMTKRKTEGWWRQAVLERLVVGRFVVGRRPLSAGRVPGRLSAGFDRARDKEGID
jgi:hypothetical protein